MSLTSDGNRMLDWAQKNSSPEQRKAVFTPMDESVDSYYERREEQGALIYEYDASDFPQIKTSLEELWQGEEVMGEMILISSVSAMKHKPVLENEEQGGVKSAASNVSDREFEIPEYVYVF